MILPKRFTRLSLRTAMIGIVILTIVILLAALCIWLGL